MQMQLVLRKLRMEGLWSSGRTVCCLFFSLNELFRS